MIKVNGPLYAHVNNSVSAGLHMEISRVSSSIVKLHSFVKAQIRKEMSAALTRPKYCYIMGSDDSDTSLLRSTISHSVDKQYSFHKLSAINTAMTKHSGKDAVICILVNCESDDHDIKLAKAKAWVEVAINEYDLPVFLFVGVPNAGQAPKMSSNFIEPLFDFSQITHVFNRRLVGKRIMSKRHLLVELQNIASVVEENEETTNE